MFDLIKELCALDGISGREDAVRERLAEAVRPFADELRTDAMGNLMALRRGANRDGRTLMLCAHMDEVGLIVKRITQDGMLRFGCVGGIDSRVLPGKRVRVGPKAIPGVLGIKAYHLREPEREETAVKTRDMYIDVGAENHEECARLVELGDPVAFSAEPESFGDGLLKAKALDDRVGCALLVRWMREEPAPASDTWVVFTAQEETGARGAAGAGFALRPDMAVIVECTTSAESPDTPAHKQVCTLGGGVVIPGFDRGALYDDALVQQARAIADRDGILWQTKEFLAGGTDAGVLHLTRGGVPCLALSAPARYLHSPSSVCATSDIDALYRLLCSFLREFRGELAPP